MRRLARSEPRLAVLVATLRFAAALVAALWVGLAGPLAAETRTNQLVALTTGDATRGWEAVGRLNLGRGGFCTGALIADDLVLTAAHCLYQKDTGALLPVADMEFLAGFRNGRAEAYRGIRRAMAHPDYAFLDGEKIQRVSVDLALLQLDRPIRSTRIHPFATRIRLDPGEEVGVVSYARDRAEAPSLEEVCQVLERSSGVVMLSCSVDFGSSGAPIFVPGINGPEIVSVVSAKAEANGQKVSLGSEIGQALPLLLSAFAAADRGILNRGSAFAAAAPDGAAKFLKP